MVTALPQLLKIWRTRITSGVSTKLWQLSLMGASAWTAHGFLTDQPAIAWPTAVLFVMQVGILLLVAKHERLAHGPLFLAPPAGGLALTAIDVIFGSFVFGLFAVISPVLGQFAQLMTMRRAADLHGVSKEYLLINFTSNALWFVYGVLAVEWAMRVSAGAQAAAILVVIAYYAHRRFAVKGIPAVVAVLQAA